MKKSLLALALFGAVAVSANAASVTLYGKLDAGLFAAKTSAPKAGEAKKSNSDVQLAQGIVSGNRFGLKGVEEIGGFVNKIGFQLEAGFNVANGAQAENNVIFNRESRVYLDTVAGQVNVGRFGALDSGAGSQDVVYSQYAIGDSDNAVTFNQTSGRQNLAVSYNSPVFAGTQIHAMYANSEAKDHGYFGSKNAYYAGAAVTGEYGPVGLVVSYSTTQGAKEASKHRDVTNLVNVAGSYDLEVVKLYAGYQFANQEGAQINNHFNFGATAPLGNGELAAQVGFSRGKGVLKNRFSEDVRYTYNLSSRTNVYAGLGASNYKNHDGGKGSATQAYVGLGHSF